MVNDIRFKKLEKAKFAGLSRDFSVAYVILDALLLQNSNDIEARRLYGNLQEMEAFGQDDPSAGRRLLKSARRHYREILEADAKNLYALLDLADQMAHFGRMRCAAKLYERFLVCDREAIPAGYEDEVVEATKWLRENGHA